MSIYLGNNLINSANFQKKIVESIEIEDNLINRTIQIYENSSISQINVYAFAYCSSLTQVNLPNCTYIGSYAFYYCSSLTQIDCLNCVKIDREAFVACINLTRVNFPNCTSISYDAFWSCYSLTSINFPKCARIENYTFEYCTNLRQASFPKCTYINNNAFQGCYNLVSFNLSGISSVPYLSTNVFKSTPIGGYSTSAGQYGSIYVPASLYSSFLTTTNWSDYASRIVSI